MSEYEPLLPREVVRREQRPHEIRIIQAMLGECFRDMRAHAEFSRLAYPREAARWEMVLCIVEALELQNVLLCPASVRRLERGLEMISRMTA